MPRAGLKLQESWEGPYLVVKPFGPVTYKIDMGTGRTKVAHISMLKKFKDRWVKRVTSVFDMPVLTDKELDTNDKLGVIGEVKDKHRKEQLGEVLSYFENTSEKPGLNKEERFHIDTGDTLPIALRPYKMPGTMKEGVEEEIAWLLRKGYIRESTSPWASPIVTVRKPNGKVRLCVDFKKIYVQTTPLPFYMPLIVEVIEVVGSARYISYLRDTIRF